MILIIGINCKLFFVEIFMFCKCENIFGLENNVYGKGG